jgi:hypothetical protein
MKISHYLRLLAYEPRILLVILPYGAWVAWISTSSTRMRQVTWPCCRL